MSVHLPDNGRGSLAIGVLLVFFTGTAMANTYPEQEPDNTCPGQMIHCGDSIDPGNIDPAGDIDWYKFDGTVGDQVTIETTDGSGGCAGVWDTVIYLYASNCTSVLTQDDDSGQGFYSKISDFILPYTGSYDVKVVAYSDVGTGCYRLSLTCRAAASAGDAGLSSLKPAITPNPTTGGCRISFRAPAAGPIEVKILDVQGRVVWHSNGWAAGRGYQLFVWSGRGADGRSVPTGIYLVRVATRGGSATGRIAIAR